jgi:hypothetical protein
MLQRYKLRLGDGTVLQVDEDGLRTWQEDGRATVQVAGTQQWRPLREVLVDMESAARLARALVPPAARQAPAPTPPPGPPPSPSDEIAIGAPPLVQTLADETATAGTPSPPWRDAQESTDEAPIRLKPLEAEPPRHAVPWARSDDHEEEEEVDERHDRLEGPLLQVLSALGNVLSRCLDPLTPLVRGFPSVSTRKPVPPRPPAQSAAPKPARSVSPPPQVNALAEEPGLPAGPRSGLDALPVIPLKPLEDERRPQEPAWRQLMGRFAGWGSRLRERLGRPLGEGRPTAVVPPVEPAPRNPPAPTSRVPVEAPPPLAALPVLRFAETREAPVEEDVYEDESEAESVFPVFWLWTKRLFLVGGLVTAGVLVALNWATWFPRAAEVGETVFTEIDRQAHSGERAQEREQALRAATEQLPHLAPETVRLVLSTSSTGVLDPPEVFQLAREAADRGRSSLAPAEAAELLALERELLAHLRPPERARLAEYDRARSQRAVFPFENPYALELVARGTRGMPEARRERLQVLLGKAVAAGLRPPAASP